jgi:hypothetical protein
MKLHAATGTVGLKKVSDVCVLSGNRRRIFRGGMRTEELATYFSRPTPHRTRFAN